MDTYLQSRQRCKLINQNGDDGVGIDAWDGVCT